MLTFTAAVLLLATLRCAVAAPHFDAALWNSFSIYKAAKIHADLLFAPPDGPRMFPLDLGFDVKSDCAGPSRPFPSPLARRAPGACEYAPAGGDMWAFWQKLPSERLRASNCYCYALDRFEGGWCMPGLGGGKGDVDPATMTCADLTARVLADGAQRATRDAAVSGAAPAEGHYIAMWHRPQSSCNFAHCGADFHFARRDASGRWSHKVGDGPAADRDADGKPILDPEAAKLDGGYTDFCGYFLVTPSRMAIGAQRTPDRVSTTLARWKGAGFEVRVEAAPYDASVDFVDDAARAKERARLQQLQQGGPAAANAAAAPANSGNSNAAAPASSGNSNAAAPASNSNSAPAAASNSKAGGGSRKLLGGSRRAAPAAAAAAAA